MVSRLLVYIITCQSIGYYNNYFLTDQLFETKCLIEKWNFDECSSFGILKNLYPFYVVLLIYVPIFTL